MTGASWLQSLASGIGAAMLGLCAGYACAQSMSGLGVQSGQTAAQSFVASQGAALNATATAGDTSVVAGAQSDTSAYQGLAANPAGLASAGQAASAGDASVGLVGTAYTNQDSASVSSNDAWYQASLSGVAAQTSQFATSGSPQQTCQTTQTQTEVTSNNGLYTCDSTAQVTDSTPTCVQNLQVSTQTTDLYACQNTYDQTSRQWVTSPACAALADASQCASTAQSCTAPANPFFQATQCTAGTDWTVMPQTCSETRNVVLGTDYTYSCANAYDPVTQTWVTSPACAALSASPACNQQTQACGIPTPTTSKTCQQGVEGEIANQTCDPVLQVTVGTNYVYNANKLWNGSAYVPTPAEAALINASAGGACQLQATNCTADYPAQTYSCQVGTYTQTNQTSCLIPAMPFAATGEQLGAKQASGAVPLAVGSTWLYSCTAMPATGTGPAETCAEFQAAGCTKTAQTILSVGRPYQAGNSYPPTDRITVTQYIYSCPAPVTAANPYFAFAQRAGPGAGDAGAQAYFDQCEPLYDTSCHFVSNSCLDSGGATLAANGKGLVGTSCLQETAIYSCSSTETAPGCSPPAGYAETASSCSATDPDTGACTETSQTWTLPGGCAAYQDQWLCNADITAADPYALLQQYVASANWSNACQVPAQDPTCSLTASVVTQGAGTETIDGLPVTEPAWAEHNTYACGITEPVDTCSGNVTGCSQTAAACAQSGPDGCQLWTYSYSCPVNDGSGGCEQNTYTYQCTADVPLADPALSTSPYLISADWTNECQTLALNGACSLTNDQTDGVSTRYFSGLGVTEDGWTRTDTYSCWSSQPVDGCSGNVAGCNLTGQTCIGQDPTGACSLWQYSYNCPADDGSGNCSVMTATFTCSAPSPAGADVSAADPYLSSSTRVTGTAWDPAACPQAGQSNCQSTGTSCTEGPGLQTINGLAVTEACWQQTTSYDCEATSEESSDCNPPPGCAHTTDQCLDDPPGPNGCVSVEHDYSCSTTSAQTTTSSTCSAQLCMGTQCFSVSGSNDSGALAKAYTALAIGQSYGDPASNLQIMPGSHYACHKALSGFSNCCQDAGWGEALGFAQCSETEKTLIQMQEAGECHYVGDYCSNKSLFGVCLERTMSYCCYQGSLARIINEAGRPQVGKVWGDPKSPDCSGFTVAQFQSLNLANVDFSQFYNQALGGLTAPSASSATSSIQATLQQMQAGNTPSTLGSGGP